MPPRHPDAAALEGTEGMLTYLAPPNSNAATDAEEVGRTYLNNVPVMRQRSSDPATHDLLARLLDRTGTGDEQITTLLRAIRDNTDTLEINAENINLNTDELEALLRLINTNFTARDLASEAGLTAARDAIVAALADVATGADVASMMGMVSTAARQDEHRLLLEQIRDASGFAQGGGATENTAAATRDNVATAVARLEAIRDSTATAARQDVQTARLETIRDTILRRTDPLPPGSNNIGFVSPGTAQAVGQGRFFLSSTGRVNLEVTGGNMRFVFQNPAGSGKVISMVRLAGFSSAGSGFANFMLNPTTGVPTSTPRPTMNAIAGGGLVPAAQIRADVSQTAMGGGIDTGIVIGIAGGERFSIDLPPIVVAPGLTVGVNIPYTGTGDVTFSCYWMEQ